MVDEEVPVVGSLQQSKAMYLYWLAASLWPSLALVMPGALSSRFFAL